MQIIQPRGKDEFIIGSTQHLHRQIRQPDLEPQPCSHRGLSGPELVCTLSLALAGHKGLGWG